MEEALLPENDEETGSTRVATWKIYVEELKRVNGIALPMMVATVGQYLLRVSPIFMLGHLGQLQLSGASIATSFSNVTGFSVLFGMSSALETLCGQAFGAEQYQRLGTYTYGAIICLFIVCIPISLLWIFTDKLLILTGQDPAIATEAGKYLIWLIPTLFPYVILQSLGCFLQTQSLVFPMLLSTVASVSLQLPLCSVLVFKLKLGNAGAALSIGISYWLNAILLVLYVKYSSSCKKTRVPFSVDALQTMGGFFRFAIPSAVMICTRISNELGAGNPVAARIALCTVLLESVSEIFLASITLYLCRSILGYAFSDEKEVIDYVKRMTSLLCMSIIMDGTQAVLSGVARGSGWQHLGAYVNLGAYYLVGIPVALILGFALHLRGMGLWSGLVAGATVQSLLLSIITGLTNWENQVIEARRRIYEGEEEKATPV